MFVYALLTALVVVGLPTVVNTIKSSNWKGVIIAGGALVVVYTLALWGMFYLERGPLVGLTATNWYQNWMGWMLGMLVAYLVTAAVAGYQHQSSNDNYGYSRSSSTWEITAGMIAGLVIGVVVVGQGLWTGIVWGGSDAKTLANVAQVTVEQPGTYPDTDSNHIVVVPEQVAMKNASQAMNTQGSSISTVYELYNPTLLSIKSHVYWVIPLRPKGPSESASVKDLSPGYALVDAENPEAPAKLQTKDGDGHDLAIKYVYKGYGDTDLERYVFNHSDPTVPKDDWTLEVDDNFVPYWTASTNKLSLRTQETVPDGVLVVNAQTGEIKHYELGQAPEWLDRVYSASTVKTIMSWWADMSQNDYNGPGWGRNDTNRYKVAGDPTLVYTKEGYPVWQMQITSRNSDIAVAYTVLFDSHTAKARVYQMSDVQLESGVEGAVTGNNNNLQHITPSHLSMHKIFGRLTWVGTLAKDGNMQGVVLVPADAQATSGNTVIEKSMAAALSRYQSVLATGASSKPGEDSSLTTLKDAVLAGTPKVVSDNSGKTVVYFMLVGETHFYRVTIDPLAGANNMDAIYSEKGAKVTISFRDSGGPLREVQSYDDLAIAPTS